MKFTFLFLILFAVISAHATDGLFSNIHHSYQSPRALGMGDAFVAVADDYSALFYNPAGLGAREEGQLNLGISASGSPKVYDLYKDLNDASKISDQTTQINQYISVLQQNYGKQFLIRTSPLEAIWVRPGWGIGFVPMDLSVDLGVHNEAFPALSVRGYADTTLGFGVGNRIRTNAVGGNLFWGITGRFVNRGYISRDLNATDLVADSQILRKEDVQEGYTVDADIGLLYTPFLAESGAMSGFHYFRPSFGAVVRNVAETGFGQSLNLLGNEATQTEAPEKNYRVLDLGTKFELPQFWIFSGRLAADLRDIGHPDYSLKRGTHLGAEFDWTLFSWWKGQYRIGINQGYFAGGISALLGIFRLDLATYGEDVGYYEHPKQNRIYLVKANLDF